MHMEVIQDPVPILDENDPLGESNSPTFVSLLNVGPDFLFGLPARQNDNTSNPGRFPIHLEDFRGFSFDFQRYLNAHDEFHDLWIAKCPLVCSIYQIICSSLCMFICPFFVHL